MDFDHQDGCAHGERIRVRESFLSSSFGLRIATITPTVKEMTPVPLSAPRRSAGMAKSAGRGLESIGSESGEHHVVGCHQETVHAQEYLALERKSETRNEYYNGEIFAMAGASREHNLIVGNRLGRYGIRSWIAPANPIPAT